MSPGPPLGKGIGALFNDNSREVATRPSRSGLVREKEDILKALDTEIEKEKSAVEELRESLLIELMMKGKVDKTELTKMEGSLNEKVKRREDLLMEISELKDGVRSSGRKKDREVGQGSDGKTSSGPKQDPIPEDIDVLMMKELMSDSRSGPKKKAPIDAEHIEGLKKELDRSRRLEEVRKEAYPQKAEAPVPARPKASVKPRKVKMVRGTDRTVPKKRDKKMYEMVQDALDHVSAGDIAGSRRILEDTLEEYPNDGEVLYHMGNTCFMTEELEEAASFYKKAIESDPASFRAYNNLGVVHEKEGDKESAIHAFNQALEIAPDYARAWMNLGVLFMDLDPPLLREASIFLRRAQELQPGLVKARMKLEECEARSRPT